MSEPCEQPPRQCLTFLDFVGFVVNNVIGADIYVVAGIGAGLLGPALLVAWLAGGLVAMIIALSFAQCAAILPEAGGSYAYVKAAFGPLPAIIVGWSLYLAEWLSLAVFPVAVTGYLVGALGSSPIEITAFKIAFVACFTLANLVGIRVAGWVNDALTVAKLLPLAALVLVVLLDTIHQPSLLRAHLLPFAPLGWHGLGGALVLVFWAYAGFEIGPLPAAVVAHPRTTLPRGIMLGMLIAMGFYLLTNLAVFAIASWRDLARSSAPLALAMATAVTPLGLAPPIGFGAMTVGAVLSISGVDHATTLGTAELAEALARGGVFPRILAHRSRRFGTPDLALLVQGATALGAALLLDLSQLIDVSVFFLIVVYAATALAAGVLLRREPYRRLHLPGMTLVPALAAVASVILGLGIAPRDLQLGLAFLGAAGLVTLADRTLARRLPG